MTELALREIVLTTVWLRESRGYVYMPGAVDRIVAAAALKIARIPPYPHWVIEKERVINVIQERTIDAIEECIVPEERHIDRDHDIFDAMALPGWCEWAQHAGMMI